MLAEAEVLKREGNDLLAAGRGLHSSTFQLNLCRF
jgi:hypothetical protein